MTTVRRHVFELTPWPWRTLTWVQVPEGLETFTMYEITTIEFGSPTRVEATPAEEARWYQAAQAFEEELRAAQSQVRWDHGVRTRPGFMVDVRTVRRRRYDLVPGRRKRSREAWARCAARMRAAQEAYRPIREEIEQRIAQAAAATGE